MAPLGNDREAEDAEYAPAGATDRDEYFAEEQLALPHEDDRLPWLESDEDYEEGAFDWRLLGYAVLGLVVVVVLLAAAYFLTRAQVDDAIVADGSTIAAPDTPYKTRPDDPGGSEVAGTGNLSFEVGEGQSRETRLAEDKIVRPAVDSEQAGTGSPAGVGVQVAAYSSRDAAREGWVTLRNRYEALSGLSHRIVEAEVDGARIYRLQAVTGNADTARAVCAAIRAAGGDCQVKD